MAGDPRRGLPCRVWNHSRGVDLRDVWDLQLEWLGWLGQLGRKQPSRLRLRDGAVAVPYGAARRAEVYFRFS